MRTILLLAFAFLFQDSAFAQQGCTVESALNSYRTSEICGLGDIQPVVMVGHSKFDQKAELQNLFVGSYQRALERFGIDNCPRDTTEISEFKKFLAKKADFCKSYCKDKKVNYSNCTAICDSTNSAESRQLDGYYKAALYMTTSSCAPRRSGSPQKSAPAVR